jgi:hypothetical protein
MFFFKVREDERTDTDQQTQECKLCWGSLQSAAGVVQTYYMYRKRLMFQINLVVRLQKIHIFT